MGKVSRILWCSKCGMIVKGQRLHKQNRKLLTYNKLENIYICPMCGKIIRDRKG